MWVLRRLLKRIAVVGLVSAAAALIPSGASAQQVYANTTTNLNQRAGPDTRYPVLVVAPRGAAVTLFGCVRNMTWCDGAYRGYRGWFAARYLTIPYRGTQLSVASYVRYAYLPTVAFNINSYWDRYYRDRSFYARLNIYSGSGSVNVAIGSFYKPLAAHGRWVEVHGRYVWVPHVRHDWRPYTDGRWVYTNRYGWTWVSNEPFGWATYHYGRWAYSARIGWFWVPGTQWAPAWVAWRSDSDHLAWAPLPPEPSDSYGVSVTISFGNIPNYYWNAVRTRDFQSDNIENVVIGDNNSVINIVNNSREVGTVNVVNNIVVNNNIDITYVEQATGQSVEVRDVALTSSEQKRGQLIGNTVEIYHPEPQALIPTKAPTEVATEEQVAQEPSTAGQQGSEPATEDMVPPPPAADQVPAVAVMSAPPMEGVAVEGDMATAPAGEAIPEGAAPEGVEACEKGTSRQPDGSCAAPVAAAQPAEELTPDTPAADAPPPVAEGQPPAEAIAPADTGRCPEGTVRQQDGLCAAPVVEAMPPSVPEAQPKSEVRPAPEPAPPAKVKPKHAPEATPAPAAKPAPAPEPAPPAKVKPTQAPEAAPAPAAKPAPAPEPAPPAKVKPTQAPEAAPAPASKPAPAPEPAPPAKVKPKHAPEATPAPAAKPAPAPEPAPPAKVKPTQAPEAAPAPASKPAPAPEPAPPAKVKPTQAPEAAPAPASKPAPAPEPAPPAKVKPTQAPEATPAPAAKPAPAPEPAPPAKVKPTQAPKPLPLPQCPEGQVVGPDGACVMLQ